MAFIWSFSTVARLMVLTFVAGLVLGLALGFRGTTESARPEPLPATDPVPLVAGTPEYN